VTILTELFQDSTRAAKPRDTGITHVMDKGMSLAGVSSLIEVAEDYVDILKLGWCTSVVVKNLEQKLALLKSLPVTICCGGTLFELAIAHRKVLELIAFFRDAPIAQPAALTTSSTCAWL
jgi:phosphosulfolactate synthase